MSQLVKTTIILPEDLLQMTKLSAVREKTNVSQIIRDALEFRLQGKKQTTKKKDPMRLLGKFKIGIKNVKRSDIYDDYLERKMGIRF